MSEQEKLMRKIGSYQFSMWELHIFLDTHPNDYNAAQKLEEYRRITAELTAQYEAAYGPLNLTSATASRWAWVASPWPWEINEGGKK